MLALLLTMTGCASVPPASNQARNLAISFTPPPQSAGVYIFRFTGIMGRAVLWPVCLDGCAVGEVADKSYLYIQVAQFANGGYFDNPPFEGYGDPCEILLLATDRYLETNTVFTSTNDYISGDFDENYLNIIVAQSATNSTSVDGSIVAATNFVAIGTSGYYGAQIVVTNSGVHTVTSSQPVGVEVYGFGPYDAYGYFGSVVK
jgi:hypothetical protein